MEVAVGTWCETEYGLAHLPELACENSDLTDRLDSAATLARHLAALTDLDPRLAEIAAKAGSFEIRHSPGGFAGLARIVTGQQVSTASADAIWSRFSRLPGALDPAGYLGLSEEQVRGAGQSGGKYRTLRGIAEAVAGGSFDFAPLAELPAEEAIATLTRLKGVGPWTAEIYLMFSAAHPDIFPAGDVALQRAAQWAFGLDDKPAVKDLIGLAQRWSPHRSTAALLLWRYYRAVRNKEGISV